MSARKAPEKGTFLDEAASLTGALESTFGQLHALGLHLYPVDADKLPIGQWALGDTNYVETRASLRQGKIWSRDRRTRGWAILCGNRKAKVFTLDVEAAGMEHPEVRRALNSLPRTCQRPSPSGGRHAVIVVTDGPPVHTQVLARIEGVLLAEVRGTSRGDGNGTYAVVTGPGRGPLPVDFEPNRMPRSKADALLDSIRALHQPSPRELLIQANKDRSESTLTSTGSGTGRIIADALCNDDLRWSHLLDEGWTEVTNVGLIDGSRRVGLLRPAYADESPRSGESGNAIGPTLVIHSSAVPWAEPGEVFNPPQALAAARFDGDYAAAMTAVETAAVASVRGSGLVPRWMRDWPLPVLRGIDRARRRSVRDWHAGQGARSHGSRADKRW